MDANIISQGSSSTDSSLTESELELFAEQHTCHAVSPMQWSAQSTFQQNNTTTSAIMKMEQSNVAGNAHSIDHTETFTKLMYEHVPDYRIQSRT